METNFGLMSSESNIQLQFEVQCVTATKKLTYKKLQADFFKKLYPNKRSKCTVSYKFKIRQFEVKMISFEVTVKEIFLTEYYRLSQTFSGTKKLSS